MNIEELITGRRSIFPKSYTGKDIPAVDLQWLVETASHAPNHKKTKPWRFQIFAGDQKFALGQELQEIYKSTTPSQIFLQKKYDDILFKTEQSSAIVSIVVQFSGLVPEWEEVAATAMAVQNMYLLCTQKGWGCYWSSPKIAEALSKNLNIEENQRCLGLFYIGTL